VTFHLSEIPYQCIVCGECCREPWALRIDPEAISRLEGLDWDDQRSRLPPDSERELFPEGTIQCSREYGRWNVLPRVHDGCVFLEQKGTCFLHRTFGAAVKPNACVEFPYAFVETPDGVLVGLSFVCRSVREAAVRMTETRAAGCDESQTGACFSELEDAYRRSQADPARSRRIQEPLRLQEGIPLSWEEYLRVEAGLIDVLSVQGPSLNDRLVAGEVFLGLLAEYLQATRATEDDTARKKVLIHYVESVRQDEAARVLRIAIKIRPNPHTRRVVTSLFESFSRRSDDRGPRGKLGSFRLACAWVRQLAGAFLRRPDLPCPDDAEDAILCAYVRHVIWRKGLLVGASPYFTGVVRRGYANLLVTVAFILERWGRNMAQKSRRAALLDALRVVERDFVLHGAERGDASVHELINRYRLPLHLFDNLTHRRFFARSMVG
jgi:hypothetical protein